jgi:hypothetical protein
MQTGSAWIVVALVMGPYSTSPTYSRSLDLVRGQFRHLYVVRIYGAIHLSSTNNFKTSADKAYFFFHQGV